MLIQFQKYGSRNSISGINSRMENILIQLSMAEGKFIWKWKIIRIMRMSKKLFPDAAPANWSVCIIVVRAAYYLFIHNKIKLAAASLLAEAIHFHIALRSTALVQR